MREIRPQCIKYRPKHIKLARDLERKSKTSNGFSFDAIIKLLALLAHSLRIAWKNVDLDMRWKMWKISRAKMFETLRICARKCARIRDHDECCDEQSQVSFQCCFIM